MDEEISRWIIEFLVRQPIDDKVLDSLLSTLPLQNDDSRLKKALLLRRIRSEVSNGVVSEKVLDMLELVGELDIRDGKVVLESMKMAYCAVAVDCTVRFLDEELENNGDYFEAMKRIWRVRIRKMEKSENPGLISEKLLRWRDDLEAVTRDHEIRDKILSRNTRNEALKAVKSYLQEAWNDMGPSFLEKTAERVGNMGGVEQEGTGDEGGRVSRILENGVSHHETIGGNGAIVDCDGGGQRPNGEHNLQVDKPGDRTGSKDPENAVVPRDGMIISDGHTTDGDYTGIKHGCEHNKIVEQPDQQRDEQVPKIVENAVVAQHAVDEETQGVVEIAVRHKHVNLCGVVRGPRTAKIADPDDMDEDICVSKNNGIPPPEASEVQEGFDSRPVDAIHTGIEPQNTNSQAAVENPGVQEVHADNVDDTQQNKKVDNTRAKESNSECPGRGDEVNPGKASLMDRKPSAHTYTWEELGETSAGASPSQPYLPSPKKRRIKRRWTPLEEDMLRTGVKNFGKGNWKLILQAYRDVFQGRSEVDLKDKWRNMTR